MKGLYGRRKHLGEIRKFEECDGFLVEEFEKEIGEEEE